MAKPLPHKYTNREENGAEIPYVAGYLGNMEGAEPEVFQHEELSVAALVSRIRDEAILWNMAGAKIPFDPG